MALQLGDLFRSLRPRSALSLKQALEIADTEGVGGTLVIQIPPEKGKPVEVFVTTGRAELVHELWKP